ncbi:hypothetical protein NX772_00160 [Mesomycoplasma molare]|uniref:Uncharacterized protein n=1 Tax=Mesomycoplasma molare TaxID=171288 RepID=A0ABY5TU89_9BACT|nr:hypothetical protein [Mesomycoplasma molare]UWD34234.1 hypothetical protein NX772_00160 [Mesomycoplasma molare]
MSDYAKVLYILAAFSILESTLWISYIFSSKGEIIRYLFITNKKIQKINKQKNPVYVNEIFKKGLETWKKEVFKSTFISYIIIFFFLISIIVNMSVNLKYLFIEKNSKSNLIFPFTFHSLFSLVIFFTLISPKLILKKIYKSVENWHFSKEQLFFDREYTYTNEKVTGYFKIADDRYYNEASYSEMRKKFNSKDISWYYVLIWGLHFSEVEKIIYSPNHKDVYQEFVNLLHEQNNQ